MHKYKLKYEFEHENNPGGYTKEELGSKGGCDAFLGISIIKPDDGSYSQACVVSIDGEENRKLTQKEIFKVWLTLGVSLHNEGELKGWQKEFAELHSLTVQKIFKSLQNSKV